MERTNLKRMIAMTVAFLVMFIAVDLYARESELERHSGVYENEEKKVVTDGAWERAAQAVMYPVDTLKQKTEKVVLQKHAEIEHKEKKGLMADAIYEDQHGGPAVRIAF